MLNQRTYTRKMALGLAAVLALTAVTGVSQVPDNPVEQAQKAVAYLDLAQPSLRIAQETASVAQAIALPEDRYGVWVDGVPMTLDPMLTDWEGEVYASLRALAQALLPQAEITWDGSVARVSLPGVLELTALPGQSYFVANGRYLYLKHQVIARSGAVLLPLDAILKALDASYTWGDTLSITSGSGGIQSGDSYYNANDLYWLSHIIYAESGNQSLQGKIAVGNVVLNRLRSPRFPNTIQGVIFQKNQFSPAASGSVYAEPNQESVLAAKLCLDGGVALDNILWFNRAGLKSWASRNRTYVATIGAHAFYA